ncbi:hypothetical protein POHY109586_10380 [Polaromonas hydrogenivorans]
MKIELVHMAREQVFACTVEIISCETLDAETKM